MVLLPPRREPFERRATGSVLRFINTVSHRERRCAAPARRATEAYSQQYGARSATKRERGAGPRKGFVARQARPEARRASAGASAEAYGKYAAQERAEPARRSPGIACRSRKGSPLGDRRLRLGLHRQPFVGLPAPRSADRQEACAPPG